MNHCVNVQGRPWRSRGSWENDVTRKSAYRLNIVLLVLNAIALGGFVALLVTGRNQGVPVVVLTFSTALMVFAGAARLVMGCDRAPGANAD